MMVSVFALTAFLIVGALSAGYLFAFLRDVPLQPGKYPAACVSVDLAGFLFWGSSQRVSDS
jgi:hypothetical protein